MLNFFSNIDINLVLNILKTFALFAAGYFLLGYILRLSQKRFLKKAKTKREKSNVKIFFQTAKYILIFLLAVFAILSYAGSLAGIGLTAGLLSAALGWALQRPITGIAGWIMVVITRPFEIGDRVIMGTIKGDVKDITLTHIYINEIGGTIASEESSRRIILIPNSKLFEQDIINYTKEGDFILDQVVFHVTFESDIEEAKKIALEAAKKVSDDSWEKRREPYTRTFFQPSGIDVYVRFECPAVLREEVASNITQEIFQRVMASKRVKFAYTRNEVYFSKREH